MQELQTVELAGVTQARNQIQHLARRQAELGFIAAGVLPLAGAEGGQAQAHADAGLDPEFGRFLKDHVELGRLFDHDPARLSGGQKARVALARTLLSEPRALLLDEPFGMLDSLTKMELQQVLLDLWRKFRITTLMVTHDVDEAIFLSDRVVMMTDGPEAEVGDILRIPFERPRDRAAMLADPRYYELRQHLITVLNDRSHLRPSREPGFQPSPDLAAEYSRHPHRRSPGHTDGDGAPAAQFQG